MSYGYLEKSIEITEALREAELSGIESGLKLGTGGSFDVRGLGSTMLNGSETFVAAKVPRADDENSLLRLSLELAQATFIAHHAPSLERRLPLFFAHTDVPDIDGGVLLTEDASRGRSIAVLRASLPPEDKQAMAAGSADLGMTYDDFDTEPAEHSLAFYVGDGIRYLDFTPIFIRDFLTREETEDVNDAVDTAIAEGLLTV